MKDGAFLSAFTCSSLDLNSASREELDAHRAQANRALLRLDDGFMYNVDLIRHPSVDYQNRTFPDAVSATLDREREIQYSAEGRHYETDCVLAITYRPPAPAAEMPTFLSAPPTCSRSSVRGIPVGPRTAVNQLSVYRRNWFQKRLGLRGVISEHFGSGAAAAFQNQHALKMAADADEAITQAEGGAVRFCYVTPKVVITEHSAQTADENAQLVFKVCQNMGFDPRIENINAV